MSSRTFRLALATTLVVSIGGIAVTQAAGLAADPAPVPADQPASAVSQVQPQSDQGSLGTVATTTTTAATTTLSTTSAVTRTLQETRLGYSGRWGSAASSGYLGGRASYSTQRGATATFRFTGTTVSWIGPTGPTRGSAKVYVNGVYRKTVSLYSRSFSARRTVLSLSFTTQRARTLKIVVVGTRGRPMVAIDALRVRSLVTTTTTTAPTTPAPTTPPPTTSGKTVNVSSIPALKSALADNSVDQIVVANGTYRISPSSSNLSNSLWIGPAYAGRTRPVLVRAETIGGVTFDGGGGSGYRALAFEAGAHDQTWDGFRFANMAAVQSGIIEIGGYTTRAAPHHITLRHITILRSCTGRATTANGSTWDHAVYLSQSAAPGAHDLLFEDMVVQGEGNLATAFHFFHGADTGAFNAHNVTVRRLTVTGTQQAFLIWEPTVYNVVLDGARISNARAYAIRFETIGSKIPSGIQIRNVTSTGSGYAGFYSTLGAHPPGVTFYNDSLH